MELQDGRRQITVKGRWKKQLTSDDYIPDRWKETNRFSLLRMLLSNLIVDDDSAKDTIGVPKKTVGSVGLSNSHP